MNLLPWPKEWSGSGPVAAWMKRLLNRCKQEEFLESKDFRRIQTNNGYFIEAKVLPGGSGKGKTLDANYKLMAIIQLGSSLIPPKPDLLICAPYNWLNNSIIGGNVFVAKDSEARQAINKEFYFDNGDNVTQTYVYFTPTTADPTYGDNFRQASDGLISELQVMEKRYITLDQLRGRNIPQLPLIQAFVWVIDTGLATGVQDPQGNDVTRLEVKPLRAWVKYTS